MLGLKHKLLLSNPSDVCVYMVEFFPQFWQLNRSLRLSIQFFFSRKTTKDNGVNLYLTNVPIGNEVQSVAVKNDKNEALQGGTRA